MPGPGGLRPLATEADRERLVALLREHYAVGLFGLDELDRRVGTVLSARFLDEAGAAVTDFVADLREQDGGTIGVGASPSLVRSLIAAGLLDELTLMISPVVAGGGRQRLFADDAAPAKFELAEATPTSTGALIATYRPAR